MNANGDKLFTSKEISQIFKITRQAVETRAKKEKWHYIKEAGNGRGGETKKYPLSSLPADVLLQQARYEFLRRRDHHGTQFPAVL